MAMQSATAPPAAAATLAGAPATAAPLRRGRHDLALYVFDSDFSVEGGKACLLDDVSVPFTGVW